MWLVQAFYATERRKWQEVETFETREAAQVEINRHSVEEACYLVELWQHAGCHHAVG